MDDALFVSVVQMEVKGTVIELGLLLTPGGRGPGDSGGRSKLPTTSVWKVSMQGQTNALSPSVSDAGQSHRPPAPSPTSRSIL